MHFKSKDPSAVVELPSKLTQAGSSSSVDRFSSAVAALFTKTTHNISKPLLFLPASDRPHHCRWAHGGVDFSWGPPTQVLKSYIPSLFGCSFSSSSSCPIFLSLLILLIRGPKTFRIAAVYAQNFSGWSARRHFSQHVKKARNPLSRHIKKRVNLSRDITIWMILKLT